MEMELEDDYRLPLQLSEAGCVTLRSWGLAVLPLFMVGRSRSGKSSFGNELPAAFADVLKLGNIVPADRQGFTVRGGSSAISRGISVLNCLIPLPTKTVRGQQHAIGIFDVEGTQMGDAQVTNTLVALALSIGAIVVLRVVEPMIPTRDLDNLLLSSQLSSLARASVATTTTTTTTPVTAKPHLMVAMRDVNSRERDAAGGDMDAYAQQLFARSTKSETLASLNASFTLHACLTDHATSAEIKQHKLSLLTPTSGAVTTPTVAVKGLRQSMRKDVVPAILSWLRDDIKNGCERAYSPAELESILSSTLQQLVGSSGLPRTVADLTERHAALVSAQKCVEQTFASVTLQADPQLGGPSVTLQSATIRLHQITTIAITALTKELATDKKFHNDSVDIAIQHFRNLASPHIQATLSTVRAYSCAVLTS